MNSRDPFNIRKAPPSALAVLQNAATKTLDTSAATVRKAQKSLQDADMSFRMPSNVPNFENAQRRLEDHVWNRFTGNEKGLPMYKDKPATYGARRDAQRWFGGKRRIALIALALLGVLYWIGWLGRGGTEEGVEGGEKGRIGSLLSQGGIGKKGKVDWDMRRDSVRDAFLLSWKGYEEHGWGELRWALARNDSQN